MVSWPTGPGRPRASSDAVHVWAARRDVGADALALAEQVLRPDERRRADRFVRDRDRRRWIVSRGLLRILLGRYLEADPHDLEFRYGPQGKPSLARIDEKEGDLRFNVSHSGALALYAVASGAEVGVDVEANRPLPELEGVARRFFSPAEVRALRRVSPEGRRDAFYRGWTRKEAFLKANGDGITGGTRSFDVTLEPGLPARIHRVAGRLHGAGEWSLFHLEPAAEWVGAVAVPRPEVEVRRWLLDR